MSSELTNKPLLQVLNGQVLSPPPVWLMRQAGRYLPEYRALRAETGSFLDLVYDEAKACEVTMQPVRRYQMDGAILFSDILIIPDALEQELEFVSGTGPVLSPVRSRQDLEKLCQAGDEKAQAKYNQIGKTINLVAETLNREGFETTTLIGFAGGPLTVASYMVEGGGSKEFMHTRQVAIGEEWFADLIDRITQATILYLKTQIKSGAQALQIFESWAGICDEILFERFVIEPTARIVSELHATYPGIPIIGFPRGAGTEYARYAKKCGVQALGLDSSVPLNQARDLQNICPVQGNLDPAYLLAGRDRAVHRAKEIRSALSGGPHIFNLGHGVNKNTNPEMVREVIQALRE